MCKITTLFLTLLISVSVLQPVHAQPRQWPLLAQNQAISPGEASARVQKKLGGRILAVETIKRNNKTFYRIKILTGKGVVRVVTVNAANGRIR